MKDSGVEWIGTVPKEWSLTKVKNLFYIGRGRVIAQTELEDDGLYPVYSSQTKNNGCLGYINTYDFDSSQLTWTTDGANAGTVFLREGKYNCTNVCGTLLPKTDKNDLQYLKFALEYIAIFHKRADINGYKIMNNEMADIIVTLPPIIEQKRLSRFLDEQVSEIDNIIDKTTQIIEEYKKYKQSIITEKVTKGLNPDVEMKDSEIEWIGDIPCHWKLVEIRNVIIGIKDGTHSSYDRVDCGKYLLSAKNVYNEGLRISDNESMISQEDYNTITKSGYPAYGDILLTTIGGSIGRALPYTFDEIYAFQRSVIFLRPNKLILNYRFLVYSILSDLLQLQMKLNSSASAQDGIYSNDIKKYLITFPHLDEQIEIADYLDTKCSEIDNIISEKQTLLSELESYKKSLIYECVTGKREVN